MRRVHKRDLLGLGTNWGDPSDDALRDQYSTELFCRFQFSRTSPSPRRCSGSSTRR